MSLGPLQRDSTTTTTPMPVQPGAEAGRPGQQLPTTIFLPNDPVAEAMRQEEHIKAVLRKFCPEVADATEICDAARARHHECLHKWQETNEALMQAQSALNRCGPDSPLGNREDLRSNVTIRSGFEQVAKFHLNAASDRLAEAQAHLAAANRAQSAKAAVKR
jgi:hypothetical protein